MELFDRYCISLASMGLRSGLTISGAELQSVTSASAVESIMPPAALRSPAELAGAANPHNAARTRRVSAAGLAPTSGEIVTQIQLGGSRTDLPVRILYAQPASTRRSDDRPVEGAWTRLDPVTPAIWRGAQTAGIGILLACSSGLAWDGPPEIGPFACDAGHSLGSIWSAIRDLFMGRVQVMHTQKQHWLDYDPVALAVLVIGMIGLLALTI